MIESAGLDDGVVDCEFDIGRAAPLSFFSESDFLSGTGDRVFLGWYRDFGVGMMVIDASMILEALRQFSVESSFRSRVDFNLCWHMARVEGG